MFRLCHLLLIPILSLVASLCNCQIAIPVELSITPHISHFGTNYVATGAKLTGSASITDPAFQNDSLRYIWSTKDGIISGVDQHSHEIQHVFEHPDESNFIKVQVMDEGNQAEGADQFNFDVKTPVTVMDPIGKLFLEHGELLSVNLTYSGSPPFIYCYKFCSTADLICNDCIPFYTTQQHYIEIVHYLHNVGEYTLLFTIGNIMNQEVKRYTIKISSAIRLKTIPYAPIVSTILAVCILMTGIALHLRFRQTTFTETADFDFINNDDDDWNQELSFIQRVRYLLCNGTSNRPTERTRLIL